MRRLRALLVNDASLAGHHGSALVTQQVKALAAESGIDVVRAVRLDDAVLSMPLDTIELVLINGEGSLHSDSDASKRIAALSSKLDDRIPGYLVNSCEADNPDNVLKDIGRLRFRFMRDNRSTMHFTALGFSSSVVPDLTLTADLPRSIGQGPLLVTDASNEDTTRKLILISKIHGGEMVTLRTAPPAGKRKRAFAIKSFLGSIAPLPMSPWKLRYGHWDTAPEFFARLAKSRGIICGRYHAVCFALKMGTPFLAIDANAGKTSALLADIGLHERLVSIEDLASTSSPWPFSAAERRLVEDFTGRAKARAQEMFKIIANDVLRVTA